MFATKNWRLNLILQCQFQRKCVWKKETEVKARVGPSASDQMAAHIEYLKEQIKQKDCTINQLLQFNQQLMQYLPPPRQSAEGNLHHRQVGILGQK